MISAAFANGVRLRGVLTQLLLEKKLLRMPFKLFSFDRRCSISQYTLLVGSSGAKTY